MKNKGLLLIIMMALLAVVLTGCKNGSNYSKYTKIVFELEGGKYNNCTLPVIQYYNFKNESGNKIKKMDEVSQGEFGYSGYEFIGWFKTKNEDGTYSDEFNFETDTVTKEGITLYAYWEKEKNFTYQVVYIDEVTNEEVVLGSYKVQEGDTFNDYSRYNKKRSGYTPLGYYDEFGNEFDMKYEHQGDTLPVKKVYVKFIKGSYALVSTKDELIKANNSSQNIYLLNDIDLLGVEFQFGNYIKKDIQGNGYSIKNFTIGKDSYGGGKNDLVEDVDDPSVKSLYISLFKSLKETKINNISFENVTFDINTTYRSIQKMYVVPMAVVSDGNTFDDVTFTGKYIITASPELEEGNFVVVSNKASYSSSNETTSNSTFTLTEESLTE